MYTGGCTRVSIVGGVYHGVYYPACTKWYYPGVLGGGYSPVHIARYTPSDTC